MSASIDHAMWFHRPFRADEWLLYVTDSPSASNAKGFNRGTVYTEDGKLVASAIQEGYEANKNQEVLDEGSFTHNLFIYFTSCSSSFIDSPDN